MRTRRMFVTVVVAFMCLPSLALGQMFSSSGTGGSTRAVGPATKPKATIPRNVTVADERGHASGVIGGEGLTPVSPAASGGSRSAGPLTPVAVAQGEPTLGRISRGSGTLPNDGGQIWREYDLTPYTSKAKGVEKPQQAVIDWIVRETGTDVWFGTPLGILSADQNTLRVYHTPEVQEMVKGVYDRFMATSAEASRLHVRVMTVSNPNWRSRAVALLKPVEVKSTGVDAWLITRESAALLMADLRRRADFREHAAPVVDVPNGQTYPLGLTRPKQYVRSVRPKPEAFPGYEPEVGTIDEGYSMSLSPLLSADGKSIDVVVKCSVDQVEKMIDVPLEIPTPLGQPQRMSIQVPQVVSWRLHERFRWPSDHVLLLSCGVVATPTNDKSALPVLGSLVTTNRADALLLIEPVSGVGPAAVSAGGLPSLPSLLPPPPNQAAPFTASPLLPPSSHSRLR